MKYTELDAASLKGEFAALEEQYKALQAENLKLDMSRGKPGTKQLDLSTDMLQIMQKPEDLVSESGLDCRNYGVLDGLPEARKLFAELTETSPEQVIVAGNSSLNLMYTLIADAWIYGVMGHTPWGKQEKITFLCPVPGYDRHFAITESFGIQMIPVPMTPQGPDMDMIEKAVSSDASIKGIWCVPQYSNPDGYTYSDETVQRMARLKPLAPDFRLFWDNAYLVHHLDYEDHDSVLDILKETEKAGQPDIVYQFVSTSKIVFPGHGLAAFVASKANVDAIKKIMNAQTIGYDKIIQLEHVRFFGNADGIKEHMKKHAALLRPRFEVVIDHLTELGELGIAEWTEPKGGYFISLYTLDGCAKRTVQLCREAGVVLTGAGAAYPYGNDPDDHHIRIAPTYPAADELKKACEVLVLCAKIAALEKLLA